MEEHQLKAAGLKITSPRLKILNLLAHGELDHLSAEAVYQALKDLGEDVGLATVYRVLTQFEEAGLVERHFFSGNQAVFELTSDSHHDHLVCNQCNKVFEFSNDKIEQEQAIIAESLGFVLNDHRLHLYGDCKNPQCTHKIQSK